jgi:hypothetical protein
MIVKYPKGIAFIVINKKYHAQKQALFLWILMLLNMMC